MILDMCGAHLVQTLFSCVMFGHHAYAIIETINAMTVSVAVSVCVCVGSANRYTCSQTIDKCNTNRPKQYAICQTEGKGSRAHTDTESNLFAEEKSRP